MQRVLSEHPGEAGIIVYGWFRRLLGGTPVDHWGAVLVRVDGENRTTLTQVKRGPMWVGADVGSHTVEFIVHGEVVRTEHVELRNGAATLIAFRPPRRLPHRKPVEWSVRDIPL